MSCGLGHRCSSDPVLLWPWYRPTATAPIGPLAWKPPYAVGVAPKGHKKKKKQRKALLQQRREHKEFPKQTKAEEVHYH